MLKTLITATLLALSLSACASQSNKLRVATFNVSIEASNYLPSAALMQDPSKASIVSDHLKSGEHSQLRNIAEVIQRTQPDVLLLNEFDYIQNPDKGIRLFARNYLGQAQNGQAAIDYPYFYIAAVNTGIASPHDLDNNGKAQGIGGDAYGFGLYPGQYGMAVLSKFPIKLNKVRSLQKFKWKDMPNALITTKEDGQAWYSKAAWDDFRLSSKSHWDIPIIVNNKTIHILAAHPTPPTFDGKEDRNGKRNHDEIRLLSDYIDNKDYLYDDQGRNAGLIEQSRFVIMGDLNSSPTEGDSIKTAINGLLNHQRVNASCVPSSAGGKAAKPNNPNAAFHTASWGLRVDYVLPSEYGFKVLDCGVFWPTTQDPLARLIQQRESSSDHRLVWADLQLSNREQ